MVSRWWACGLALALLGCGVLAEEARKPKAARGGSEEGELMRGEREWAEAVEKGDVEGIAHFLHTDFVFTDPMGRFEDRSHHLEDFRSGKLAFESVKLDDVRVRVYGGAAVVTSRPTTEGKAFGHDASGPYRFTDTLVKEGGRWTSVARQMTKVAGPPG